MSKNFDVFISYRRSDGSALAKAIYDDLTGRGLRVFLDEKKMKWGRKFPEQLKAAVTDAPNFILVTTPDVFKLKRTRDFVFEEIELALKLLGDESENRKVIPVVPAGMSMPAMESLPKRFPKKVAEIVHVDARKPLSGELPNAAEFLEIAKAVTDVSPHNLWNAGQRWLESSHAEHGRFHNINIVDSILPRAKKKVKRTIPSSCLSM